MLDTERQPDPAPDEATDGWSDVLTEVDEIEPSTPAEEAAPSAEQPEGTPAEAPASEGTATPAGTEAAARPEGEAPAADAPADGTSETPTDQTPVEIELDGRKLTIAEAKIDKGRGDQIVLPRAALEQTIKTTVQDAIGRERTTFGRERAQLQRQLQAAQQEKTANEHTAETLLAELDKIMELDDATSFDEWEKMRTGYRDRREKARADYWERKAKGQTEGADQERYQQEMAEYVPVLQTHLRRFTEEAVSTVKDKLTGLSEDEMKSFVDELYEQLLDDADAGKIFTHTGEKIEGTLLPKLNVNFQRIATVVERAVGGKRKTLELLASRDAELKKLREQVAKVEEAARKNAEAESKRRGTPAPPAISGKPGTEGSSRTKEPSSWDDLVAEVDKL